MSTATSSASSVDTAPAPVTAIAGSPTQEGIAPVTRVMHPAWPAVAPGEAYAYFTDGTVCFHLGNFRLHRDAVAAASAHPDGSVGIYGPGHTPSKRHWALREVKPGPGSVAERAAATHEIPNGYYPDGRSRPNVPVQVLWGPAPGSANRLATIRRLDTGEVGPCPTYAITARTPPTSIRGGLERAGVSPANIDRTIAALPQIVAGEPAEGIPISVQILVHARSHQMFSNAVPGGREAMDPQLRAEFDGIPLAVRARWMPLMSTADYQALRRQQQASALGFPPAAP